jgi:hypothetical protein
VTWWRASVRSAPRRVVPRGLIFLLLLAAPAAWSQKAGVAAGAPADVVARCTESDATEAYGLENLETPCPGIEHALVELGYSPFLSERQLDELSIYSLSDLQQLAGRYVERPAPGGIPTDSLAPILESLDAQRRAEQPLTLFARFKRWLRETFGPRQDPSDSWLSRWLEKIDVPETVTRVIVYVLIALVNILALAVLINELRAAGILRSTETRRKQSTSAGDAMHATKELTLADLDATSPIKRPSMLLRILVATLVKRGRLRAERSLTHRELVARVSLDDAAQRESFSHLSKLSERTVYGNARVSPDEIDRVVQAGRELMAQIAASAATDAVPRRAGK